VADVELEERTISAPMLAIGVSAVCSAVGVMAGKFMHNISLRVATRDDADFALHVTEACMRSTQSRLTEVGMVVLISTLRLIK
jgi:hypothetical protein